MNSPIARLVLAVVAGLILASPASAYTPEQAEHIVASGRAKISGGMLLLGRYVALARECGIPDTQMPGHLAAYHANLTMIRALQVSSELTSAQKAELGTEETATSQFMAGETQTVQAGPPKPARCEEVKSFWPSYDKEAAGWANQIILGLKKVKDPKVAAIVNGE